MSGKVVKHPWDQEEINFLIDNINKKDKVILEGLNKFNEERGLNKKRTLRSLRLMRVKLGLQKKEGRVGGDFIRIRKGERDDDEMRAVFERFMLGLVFIKRAEDEPEIYIKYGNIGKPRRGHRKNQTKPRKNPLPRRKNYD